MKTIPFGATVFFQRADEFVLVEKVVERYSWLQYVEFRGEYPFFYPGKTSPSEIQYFKTIVQRHQLKSTIHATMYDINLATLNPWVQRGNIDCYKEFIEMAERLEAEIVVVHAGFIHDEYAMGDEAYSLQKEVQSILGDALQELGEYARPRGVKIALENAPVEPRHPIIDSPETHVRLLTELNHPHVGALVDIAHARLRQVDINHYLTQIQPYLIEIHAHNNWGEMDDHLGLHHGVIDYKSILNKHDFTNIPFIMEIHSYEEAIETFNWLEREVISPSATSESDSPGEG